MVITNFNDLLEGLHNGKTFEEICSNENVERVGNIVYEDNDLYDYLATIGVGIEDFGVGFAILNDITNEKYYEVPYEVRENRFRNDLPDETVLFFDWNRIYDVTDNR